MNKPLAGMAELFERLQSLDHFSADLELRFQELKKRRLIRKEHFDQITEALDFALAKAWRSFRKKVSRADFPVLIREDQVQERFKISHATLYRRRKSQELPYVRDREGVIWYPVVELIEYYIKSRSDLRARKTGRPRKF